MGAVSEGEEALVVAVVVVVYSVCMLVSYHTTMMEQSMCASLSVCGWVRVSLLNVLSHQPLCSCLLACTSLLSKNGSVERERERKTGKEENGNEDRGGRRALSA